MKIANLVKYLLLTVLTTVGVLAIADDENSVESRLKPVGNVCVEGFECATAVVAVVEKLDENSPEGIYSSTCKVCHGSDALGAPVLGDADAWAPRIAKGVDALYNSGLNGVPGTIMVSKGGNSNLTDDQVKSVVDYFIEQAQ